MSDCLQREADSRIILHISNCIQTVSINVYVLANNTDVVALLMAFIPDFLKINAGAQVILICGVCTNKYCMSINVIAESITLESFKQLLFLHALSGSDCTSSFFHVRKVKFWNSWFVNQDVPETIIRLGDCPSLSSRKEDINVIKRFIFLYYDGCNFFQLVWLGMKSSSIDKIQTFDLYPRQELL